MSCIVRVCSLKLESFKNTDIGSIVMPSAYEKRFFLYTADILGIYGQNGSSKTAVIDALQLLQRLMSGESLEKARVAELIKQGDHKCVLSLGVTIDNDISDEKYFVEYSVHIELHKETPVIAREVLTAAINNGSIKSKKTLVDYRYDVQDGYIFTPQYRYDDIVRADPEARVNFSVAKKISEREMKSFIFAEDARITLVKNAQWDDYNCAMIVNELYGYAYRGLFVITNAHSAVISTSDHIPFAFKLGIGNRVAKGDMPLMLLGTSLVDKGYLQLATTLISSINIVLQKIIPGLTIELNDLGSELLPDGRIGNKIELTSRRGQVQIPLKNESEGIIKIVSILNVLIHVFNDPSVCLVIDELDAGIYEYLLGELLAVFEKNAKGQIIFTSHNLRPLEMLSKNSIVFSTTNSDNRYIRLQNVKNNNNLRDMYLRSILLGGQREKLYQETGSNEIARAFRRAGRAMNNGST